MSSNFEILARIRIQQRPQAPKSLAVRVSIKDDVSFQNHSHRFAADGFTVLYS